LTNNPHATFVFESTEEGSTFECSVDGGVVFEPCESGDVFGPFADGKNTFQVRATDGAENPDKSAAKAKAWTVDTRPPVTAITPPKTTTTTTLKFKFKSDEKKCTFECRLDNNPAGFAACKSGQAYTGLISGSHYLEVRATDAAGNLESTPARFDWTTP